MQSRSPRPAARTVWQALARPAGLLRTAWPWRAVAHLAGGVLSGAVTLLLLLVLCGFSLLFVGLPLLLLAGVAVGAAERWRLRLVDPEPAPDPHRLPEAPGLAAWLRLRAREQATWRELGYALLHATVLWPLDLTVLAVGLGLPAALMSTPLQLAADGHEVKVAKAYLVTSYPQAFAAALLGLLLLPLLLYPLTGYAGARAAFARALLAPREAELRQRIGEVTASRARLAAAFEAERRRIERDLHDGAQQRLVALTMTLGLARYDAPPGPLADQLAKAHDEAGRVLSELRELIHGIHPQVLADYGLGAALADAADRTATPVDSTGLDPELPRLPAAVESAAHFVAREALANVDRHSGAARARITARHADGTLLVAVEDDGHGGADSARGSGLTGLADRLAVLDGTLTITSPPGGPTLLRAEIPCSPLPPTDPASGSSSPRTASSSVRD
ncbi:sensor domain-containing protein [Streptomyces sp. SKN60]|uniref:sensor histidine kinase n=1 Tax=Streptomyces sp. SKN60 TaxID=2855506 RepID=UPI0022473A96|nr:sensor histidine kinase [Streptomyces sp. SKN60]MCX2180066.1 sensor domain-containing protein [Streptomyces sp. SKN60]